MKRLDLQSLRGIAILLVVLFHLQPDAFSLGFVGVDIFFVLSGYLMALILSKETLSRASLVQFYTRRFRRIVPLYYIVVVLVYIGSTFLIILPDREQLLRDIKWTLTFATNIAPMFKWKDYWEQIAETRFFTHCWSLAIEIQFYLIAPFIIFVSHQFSTKTRNILLLLSIFISCLSQILTPGKVSYFMLFSRVWEFLLGIVCLQDPLPYFIDTRKYEKLNDSEESPKKEQYQGSCLNNLIIVFLVGLALWNPHFPGKEHVARILSCFLVAYIISSNKPNPGAILSNKVLIYIGDISYTMYLVHWPIITAYKYYHPVTFSTQETIYLLGAIFVVTFLIHSFIEKPIITWSALSGFLICIGCVGFIYFSRNIYLSYPLARTGLKLEGHDVDEIIAWNIVEHEKVFFPLPGQPDNVTDDWTKYTDAQLLRSQDYSNGSLKILIIGNSIAYRAFPLLHPLFNGRYKELRLYARAASVPMVIHPATFPEYTVAAHKVVEMMKPDIIWIIYGHIEPDILAPFNSENKAEDRIFQQFQEHLNFYSSRAKEVIIDFPYLWSGFQVSHTIAQRFYTGNYDLSDLKMSRAKTEEQQFHHRRRLAALNCSNCQYNDVQQKFFEKETDTYYFYNRANYLAYTKDGAHLTPEMLRRVTPQYRSIIKGLLKKHDVTQM